MTNLTKKAEPGSKICKQCKQELPIENFRLYGKGKKYRFPYCIPCAIKMGAARKLAKRKEKRDAIMIPDLENELWRDVVGYEGLYKVSNMGRVKRLTVTVPHKNKGSLTTRERILKQSLSQYGYPKVGLTKNNIPKVTNVHLIVWDAFGDKPRDWPRLVVDHIDNNKLNNKLDNLQCITQRLNSSKDRVSKHSCFIGVHRHSNKSKKWEAKIHHLGKGKRIGLFYTEEEAHEAYQNALREIEAKEAV